MDFLHEIFRFVCGQAHVWYVGAEPLPFCQRCTGLYGGFGYALVAILLWRPRPTAACLYIHGGFLLFMLPFGYHLVSQSAVIRTVTGQLFAAGLCYFLVLTPLQAPNNRRLFLANSEWPYFLVIAIGIPLLLASVHFGGKTIRQFLAWMGFAGLAAASGLWGLNVLLVPTAMRRALNRRRDRPLL